MKRGIAAIVLLVLACALLAGAGCGNKTSDPTVIDNGDVQRTIVTENGKSVTVDQPQTAPTEAELGAPIYPGAVLDPKSSSTIKYRDQEGFKYQSNTQFLTSDGFDEVVGFYRGKLGEPTSSASSSVEWYRLDSTVNKHTWVKIEQGDGNVKISITSQSES